MEPLNKIKPETAPLPCDFTRQQRRARQRKEPSHPFRMTQARKDRKVDQLSAKITDQEQLDKILADAPAAHRRLIYERIKPSLKFESSYSWDHLPDEDCPQCGRHNGKVIAHECISRDEQ